MAAVKNFSYSTIAVAPSPATSGNSLTVSSGDGALFVIGRPVVIYPAGLPPLATNAEIGTVTNIVGDVLTITRAQESTSARTIVVGDQIAQMLTAAEFNALETSLAGKAASSHSHAASDVTSGTLDGDRLPAVSTTKKGGVPATGTPSGKYLKDDGTWASIPGGGDLLAANNLSDLANAATARGNLGLGDSATKNVGTGAGSVAAGDHNHSGVYAAASHTHPQSDITNLVTDLGNKQAASSALSSAQAQGTASIRAIGTTTPAALGTAAAGSSTEASAKDHVHQKPTFADIDAGTLAASFTFGENTAGIYDAALSADGKYCGFVRAGTAGTALAFGDLVYLQASDSRWELADADAASTSGDVLLGMCVLAANADGDATTILMMGFIRADAAFPALTIGAPAYVSTTAGDIQTAQPSGTDDVVRRVGFAWTADELYFNPSNDYATVV